MWYCCDAGARRVDGDPLGTRVCSGCESGTLFERNFATLSIDSLGLVVDSSEGVLQFLHQLQAGGYGAETAVEGILVQHDTDLSQWR